VAVQRSPGLSASSSFAVQADVNTGVDQPVSRDVRQQDIPFPCTLVQEHVPAHSYRVVVFATVLQTPLGATDLWVVPAQVPLSAFITGTYALAYLELFHHPFVPTINEVQDGTVGLSTRAEWPPRLDRLTTWSDVIIQIPASLLDKQIPSLILPPQDRQAVLASISENPLDLVIPANVPIITIYSERPNTSQFEVLRLVLYVQCSS
jgi:hypothetical protein